MYNALTKVVQEHFENQDSLHEVNSLMVYNDPYMPLHIRDSGGVLVISHYRDDGSVDTEARFNLSGGDLQLLGFQNCMGMRDKSQDAVNFVENVWAKNMEDQFL